jgi:hypothetical protein
VEPLLTASEIVEEDQEHLGIMAYAAKFLHLKPGSTSFQNITTTNDDRVRIPYNLQFLNSNLLYI